jgi:hypothetical protein
MHRILKEDYNEVHNIYMKIRGFLALAAVVINCMFSYAQFTNTKVKELEEFKKNGTVVVAISDDENTNKIAEEVMTEYWKATKYKVIRSSELETYLKANPENYLITYVMNNTRHLFVMSSTQMASTATPSTRTRSASVGDGLILSKNVKKANRLKPTDAMIYCFIDPDLDIENEQAEFIRQIGAMNAILMYPDLKDDQIGGYKIPTLNHKDVISKELWISELDLNKKGEDEAKMKAAYQPYKYKIVTEAELAQAILEKRKDVVYLARAEYQSGAYMFVIHATDDNRALYFTGGSAGFDSKAFEKIKNNKLYGQ